MNWHKIVSIFGLFILSFVLIMQIKPNYVQSAQSSLTFSEKLDYSLKTNNINLTKDPICSVNLGFCRLVIKNKYRDFTALISLQNDPFFQIASLQQILKVATMRDKHIEFIDLSDNRSYATLKDN